MQRGSFTNDFRLGRILMHVENDKMLRNNFISLPRKIQHRNPATL